MAVADKEIKRGITAALLTDLPGDRLIKL